LVSSRHPRSSPLVLPFRHTPCSRFSAAFRRGSTGSTIAPKKRLLARRTSGLHLQPVVLILAQQHAALTPAPQPAVPTLAPQLVARTPAPQPAVPTPAPQLAALTPDPQPAVPTPAPQLAALTPDPLLLQGEHTFGQCPQRPDAHM